MSDVIIIGGGPAGSALGCYLSQAGISNTIIEGANHPREHVGESLVAATTRIFEELDFLQTMEQAPFVRKYGASWHAPANSGKFSIINAEFVQEGVKQPYTYHVERSKFDMYLLKHAESLGSKVYQGMRVTQVLFDGEQACGVKVRVGDQDVEMSAKVVVDASGRSTLLGRQLRLKKKDPLFNQYAIHAWFEGVDRSDDESAEHIHIYFLPVERGWVWQIPITDTITSVGVVVERDVFSQAMQELEPFFYEQVQSNKNLADAMRSATRVNDFKTEGDYSYSMSKFIGDGYVLIGDAARFVDPIFSSGISIALYSAKFAAEQIVEAFKADDFSEEIFAPYEAKLRSGVEVWYEFILLYYKLLPLFTYFINSKKYRHEVWRLLQGDVFDRSEVRVLDAMRDFIAIVENSDDHIFKQKLTDIPVEALPELV